MLNKYRFVTAALIAALGLGALVAAPAQAKEKYLDDWSTFYPGSSSDENSGCVLCHNTPSASGGLNPYGIDYWIDGIVGAEQLDSDGDGCTNLEEIGFSTQPAWTSPLPSYIDPTWIDGDLDPDPTLCGAPGNPDIAVSPLAIDFGAVTVGTFATADVNIANEGTADLTVDSLALSGSAEFSLPGAPATPFTVAANTSVNVTVEYDPVDENTDNGTLEIASDSPGEELVSVALSGTGIPVVVEECVASVDPAIIDFGSVEIGASLTLSTSVSNIGGADCVVNASVIDSGVFTLQSASSFSVAPGSSVVVDVAYTPTLVGDDAGQLQLDVASPAETITVPLSGSGIEAPVEMLDLDIKRFSATKRVTVSKPKAIEPKLSVQNNGLIEGVAAASVTGMQNGVTVYAETLNVTDGVGNGSTTYEFPSYIPDIDGDILWTAVIADEDPDDDVETATTTVKP